MVPVTALYAGLLALLFVVLSIRVVVYRRRHRIGLGDQGDKSLLKRMRAQANCAEYAPLGIVLLALCELQGAPGVALHILGLMLLVGRVVHGYGFSTSPPIMGARTIGMGLTFLMILAAALGLVGHALISGGI